MSAATNASPRAWEQAMMARIRAGDDSALAAVYDQLSPLVNGIAVQLVGSAAAADVCQEVFLALWERPDRFDPERGSLRTFLAVMARRRCIDNLRSSGRRRQREERVVLADDRTVAPPDVEEAAVAMMTAQRVREALVRLPPEQRQAIELAYLEGMTFKNVAVAMGSAEGTAKSRLRLGLSRLAKELAGSESETKESWT